MKAAFPLLLATLAPLAFAEPLPPAAGRAYFFSEPDFSGECLVVDASGEVTNLDHVRDQRGRKWNDRISSVRLEGPVRVIAYGDARFKGERVELTRQMRDLRERSHGETGLENWNDRISSIKVVVRGANDREAFEFTNARAADRAILKAYREILGRDPDYSGRQNFRKKLLDDGWGEAQLRDALLRSDEFRRRDVEAIVRRVYRDELGREPDPAGFANWVSQLRQRGWTEGQLREEMRNSPEAREQIAKEIVIRAYRDVLGREPDPEGLAAYLRFLTQKGWTEQRVRDTLRNSEEFRQKQAGR